MAAAQRKANPLAIDVQGQAGKVSSREDRVPIGASETGSIAIPSSKRVSHTGPSRLRAGPSQGPRKITGRDGAVPRGVVSPATSPDETGVNLEHGQFPMAMSTEDLAFTRRDPGRSPSHLAASILSASRVSSGSDEECEDDAEESGSDCS